MREGLNMDFSGSWLRETRELMGLSQSRLAEITGISQHVLSAFELEKQEMDADTKRRIGSAINDNAALKGVITRKKRYQRHSYTRTHRDPLRTLRQVPTVGNAPYLEALSQIAEYPAPTLTGVSLFSGIGGFSAGFRSAGFKIKGFVEIDEGLSDIYHCNFPGTPKIGGDITSISDEEIQKFASNIGEVDVLIGGPPCQGFSLSGKRRIDDPRNELFRDYMRFLDILKPKVAVIENVRLLTSMKSKSGRLVKDEIAEDFRQRGYSVGIFEVNAKNFGVPQHRERVIFLAVRDLLDGQPSLPEPHFGPGTTLFQNTQPFRTFGDACSDLSFIEAGEESDDPHHVAVHHPDHVIEWLWDVPEGSSAHDNADPALRPPSGYNTTYKRQIWNEPASTVQTTFGMISGCRNVHPIATRSLTVREAARIQSFPDNYVLRGSLSTIRTGLGNAVPPLLARSLALHVRSILSNLVKIPRFKIEL